MAKSEIFAQHMVRDLNWNIDDYAKHYAEIIHGDANAWGQFVSPIFGQSHHILGAIRAKYGEGQADAAIGRAMTEYRKNNSA